MALMAFVGTYTSGKSQGIYTYEVEPANGRLSLVGITGGLRNPSFLAVAPDLGTLWTVQELAGSPDAPEGLVTALERETTTGSLREIVTVPTHGGCPCQLVVEPSGRLVLVANYLYGTATVHRVLEGGGLSEATQVLLHEGTGPRADRQEGSHPHSWTLSLDGRFGFVADLGADRLWRYRILADEGRVEPFGSVAMPEGSGPRHCAFHPSAKWLWVIGEMGNTVTTLAYHADSGALEVLGEAPTLPAGFDGPSNTADLHVHPSGRWLYGSNRGHDSIVAYAIDESDGSLHEATWTSTGGRTPRNFGLTPGGGVLIAGNQDSDSLAAFHVDPATGRLESAGPPIESPAPVCIRFVEL